MSLLNPGKRGIYTLLSVLLIIGIPGAVAYADSSTDTYYSLIEDDSVPNLLLTFDSSDTYLFDLTCVDNGDGLDISVADTAHDDETSRDSLTVTGFNVYGQLYLSSLFDKITVSSDLALTSVFIRLYQNSTTVVATLPCTYDESAGVYSVELSALDKVMYADADSFRVILSQESGSVPETFALNVQMYSAETVFTDDVVELIVLVGGIALLVLGTMALSFFDVTTPGKAFRSAGRSVRNITRRK